MVGLRTLLLAALVAATAHCAGEYEPPSGGRTPSHAGSAPDSLHSGKSLFPWTAGVSSTGDLFTATPGDTWSADLDLEVDLGAYDPRMGRFEQLIVAVYGERQFDERGTYRAGSADHTLSSHFTVTGIPVDTFDAWPSLRLIHGRNGSPFEGLASFALPAANALAGTHRFRVRVEVDVPADIPPGWWRPRVALLVKVEGVSQPVYLASFYEEFSKDGFPPLPLVAIGEPATPQLPWTLLATTRVWGRVGTLPEELKGTVGITVRSGFPSELQLPPGIYPLAPTLPSLFPRSAVPTISGPVDGTPGRVKSYLRYDLGEVSCVVEGPTGEVVDLGTRAFAGVEPDRVIDGRKIALEEGPFLADLTAPGTYRIRMRGHLLDHFGRRFEGGGTYVVHAALPLTLSTSCKPATPFLVGGIYPPKVNVLPPVPATVEVTVDYYPQSDPARKRVWRARGQANRFGHFVPYGTPPLRFDEPGEYRSLVRATYRDAAGRLWMRQQASAGVVAPTNSVVTVHGTQRTRNGRYPTERRTDEERRYAEQMHHGCAIGLLGPTGLAEPHDPSLPFHPEDTLFIQSSGGNEFDLELSFSAATSDARLAKLLLENSRVPARSLPWRHQGPGRWRYLEDVLTRGYGSGTWNWSPTTPDLSFELPLASVSRGPLHPIAFPQDNRLDGYIYAGAVRPGLPAVVAVMQGDGFSNFWALNPNSFGHQFNTGPNGDLPGDIYRVQAGLVLRDHDTGTNYYDAYSTAVAIVAGDRPASAVLPVGVRPLFVDNEREHFLFLATDTHDVLEVGERIHVGGMVFPNVPADVTWTITTPSGRQSVLGGRADARGIVGSPQSVAVDEPGRYDVRVRVRHGELVGGIPGTADGAYWIAVLPKQDPELLGTDLPPFTRIDPAGVARIPLRWPAHLRDVRIHYGVLMPGRVIEQGTVPPAGNEWTYAFSPLEAAIRLSNYDVRDYRYGMLQLADTVVFLFLLEGRSDAGPVYDSLRFVLRGDKLFHLGAL